MKEDEKAGMRNVKKLLDKSGPPQIWPKLPKVAIQMFSTWYCPQQICEILDPRISDKKKAETTEKIVWEK